MKVMKTKQIPAKTEQVLDHVKCELCPRTMKDWNNNWATVTYDVDRIEVCSTVGENYPEGGHATDTILDICPDCFKTKLIPWFKAQGGTPRTEEHDY